MMRMVYQPQFNLYLMNRVWLASSMHPWERAQESRLNKDKLRPFWILSVLKVKEEPVISSMVEFRSSRITRVVKFSQAAEGNALSTAADEQLFLRLLTGALWYGPEVVKADWKESLLTCSRHRGHRCEGVVRSLRKDWTYDFTEANDVGYPSCKTVVESASMMVAWVPTFRQFADVLTKDMVDELFKKYKRDGLLCLRETANDARSEAHHASLRKAQRERRKLRMKAHDL